MQFLKQALSNFFLNENVTKSSMIAYILLYKIVIVLCMCLELTFLISHLCFIEFC